jgi:hypothetical protein
MVPKQFSNAFFNIPDAKNLQMTMPDISQPILNSAMKIGVYPLYR